MFLARAERVDGHAVWSCGVIGPPFWFMAAAAAIVAWVLS